MLAGRAGSDVRILDYRLSSPTKINIIFCFIYFIVPESFEQKFSPAMLVLPHKINVLSSYRRDHFKLQKMKRSFIFLRNFKAVTSSDTNGA
jgi:hypothetical protein